MSNPEIVFAQSHRRSAANHRDITSLHAIQSTIERWHLSGTRSTIEQYAAVIVRYEGYCNAKGLEAQPGSPETVAGHIWHRRSVDKVGQASLDADARAIRQGHLSCHLPDPTNHPVVREALGRKRRAATDLKVPFANVGVSLATPRNVSAQIAPRSSAQLPVSALSLEELDPIVEFFKLHSLAGGTRCTYGHHLKFYKAFCERHVLCPLPAKVATVVRFLGEYGLSRTPGTLRNAKAAIRWVHHAASMFSPTDHPDVAAVIKGHARLKGTRKRKKYAFTTDDVLEMCNEMDKVGGVLAVRDRALLLFGFAGCFRRSEITMRKQYAGEPLVFLDLGDLCFTRHGVRTTIRKSKTDQEGKGEDVFITFGAEKTTCAVLALQTWIELLKERGITTGPVFRPLYRKGDPLCGDATIGDRPLTGHSVADRFKYWGARIGLDPKTIGAHSVRRGHATTASENGASPIAIQHQGRWKSYDSMMEYIERSNEHMNNSSSTLGL